MLNIDNTTIAIDQLLCADEETMRGVEILPLFVIDKYGSSKRYPNDAISFPAKTSCLNLYDYKEILEARKTDNYIYIAFNEKWSTTTFNAFDIAAKEDARGRVIRINSKGCSVMAIPIIKKIKELLQKGADEQEIIFASEEIADGTVGHFMPKGISELKVSGRIPRVLPLLKIAKRELIIQQGVVSVRKIQSVPDDAIVSAGNVECSVFARL